MGKKKNSFLMICIIAGLSVFNFNNILAFTISSTLQKGRLTQQKALPAIAYSADLKIGPFRIQPIFSIKNMGYDSNIFSSPTKAIADYTATPSAGLRSVVLLGRRGYLSLGGELGYLWFYQTTAQNFLNRYADAHLEINFSRLSIYIEEGFAHVRDRYGYEIDLRTNHTTNSASVGFKFEPSRKTFLELVLSQDLLRYDSEASFRDYRLRDVLNRIENNGRFTFGFQLRPKTRALIELNYGENNFDNPASDLNSLSYKALLGVELDASALIQGIFKIGYKYLIFPSSRVEDYQGLAGFASLSYRFADRISFLFSYNRDTYYSYFAYYYFSDLYGGLITFYLSDRIGIDLGSTIVNNKYPLREVAENEIQSHQVIMYRLGFKYRLKEGLTTGIAAAYRNKRTNTDYNLEGFTVFSLLSYEF